MPSSTCSGACDWGEHLLPHRVRAACDLPRAPLKSPRRVLPVEDLLRGVHGGRVIGGRGQRRTGHEERQEQPERC